MKKTIHRHTTNLPKSYFFGPMGRGKGLFPPSPQISKRKKYNGLYAYWILSATLILSTKMLLLLQKCCHMTEISRHQKIYPDIWYVQNVRIIRWTGRKKSIWHLFIDVQADEKIRHSRNIIIWVQNKRYGNRTQHITTKTTFVKNIIFFHIGHMEQNVH